MINTFNRSLLNERELLDAIIEFETAYRLLQVKEAVNFMVRTAYYAPKENEFVLVADYDVPKEIQEKLENVKFDVKKALIEFIYYKA